MDRVEFGDDKSWDQTIPIYIYMIDDQVRPPSANLKWANWQIRNLHDGGVPGYHGLYDGEPYYSGDKAFCNNNSDDALVMQSALFGRRISSGYGRTKISTFLRKEVRHRCGWQENLVHWASPRSPI